MDEQAEAEDKSADTPKKPFDVRDPYQLHEVMRVQYLEEFGDIPEVHIVVDGWLKGALGEKKTPEEQLEFMEAMYHLNPHPSTKRSIEIKKMSMSGEIGRLIDAGDFETLDKIIPPHPSQPPESEQPFYDVKRFFEGNTPVEGFRRLRAADPKRSVEFEDFIREEARKDPSMSVEEIEADIRRSYEPPEQNK